MNLIERAIAAVSPRLAAQRLRDRVLLATMSGLEGAKANRAGLRNFNPRPRGADEDTLPQLDLLRARSRDMVMNAPLAGGAVRTVVTNVVGTGLVPSPQARRAPLLAAGLPEDAIDAFEEGAKAEWAAFAHGTTADARGKLNFAAMQDLAFRSTLESGDCFAAVVQGLPGGAFDFALQLIEADRVQNPHRKPDGDNLAGGIEFDAGGRPLACHVAETSRMTGTVKTWRRLDMRGPDGLPRVIHIHRPDRIDQTRGVPYLAPVIGALKDLDRYTEAEVTAAVLSACIAIMGHSPTGASPLHLEAAAGGGGTASAELKRADIRFEPGMVLEGFAPGETLESFATNRPNTAFDPFVQAVLRQVGVALELPFEVLIKHFTASYSAARAALLEAWRFFRVRREWLAATFCQPVYELVIWNAVLAGRLDAPGLAEDPALRAAWMATRWTGDSPGQIDPLREVEAAEKRLELLLTTRTEETAALTGGDWEAVVVAAGKEQIRIDAAGLAPAPVAAPSPALPAPRRDDADADRPEDTEQPT